VDDFHPTFHEEQPRRRRGISTHSTHPDEFLSRNKASAQIVRIFIHPLSVLQEAQADMDGEESLNV
jgi:hypothetical protein